MRGIHVTIGACALWSAALITPCLGQTSHTITAGTSVLTVEEDASPTGFRFVSAANSGGGHTYAFITDANNLALGNDPLDVWRIVFWNPASSDVFPTIVGPSNCFGTGTAFSSAFSAGAYQADWTGCISPDHSDTFDVTVKLEPHASGDAIACTIDVVFTSASPAVALHKVRFPNFQVEALPGDPTAERLVYSHRNGVLHKNPRAFGSTFDGLKAVLLPAAGNPQFMDPKLGHTGFDRQSMQFSCYYSEDASLAQPENLLFLGTRDEVGYWKEARWALREPLSPAPHLPWAPNSTTSYLEYFHEYVPINGTSPNNGGIGGHSSPYPFVLAVPSAPGRVDRWYDAAKFYRNWVQQTNPGWLGQKTVDRAPSHMTESLVMGGAGVSRRGRPCAKGAGNGNLPVQYKHSTPGGDLSECKQHPIYNHLSRQSWQSQMDALANVLGHTGTLVHRTDGWPYTGIGQGFPGQWWEPGTWGKADGFQSTTQNAPTHPYILYFFPRPVAEGTDWHDSLESTNALVISPHKDTFGAPILRRELDNMTICESNKPCDPATPQDPNQTTFNGVSFPFLGSVKSVCLSETTGQDYVAAHTLWLAINGAGGVYLDEFTFEHKRVCYADNHSHTSGGGTYLTDQSHTLLARMKSEAAPWDDKFTIITEHPTELTKGLVDGAHWEPPFGIFGDELLKNIPLFAAVYHDYQRGYRLAEVAGADSGFIDDPINTAKFTSFRAGIGTDMYHGLLLRGVIELESVQSPHPDFPVVSPLSTHIGAANTIAWTKYIGFEKNIVEVLQNVDTNPLHYGERLRDLPISTTPNQEPILGLPIGNPPVPLVHEEDWVRGCAFHLSDVAGSRTLVILTNWTDSTDVPEDPNGSSPPASLQANVTIDPADLLPGANGIDLSLIQAPSFAPTQLLTNQTTSTTVSVTIPERGAAVLIATPH